jgi:hypothetical protein
MIVTFTLVRKQPALSTDAFLARWIEHTERFDLKDHPYITKNRLMLIEGDTPYVGLAENHWPDQASLDRTYAFYRDHPAGRAHWADLETFMDIENSPTVVVTREADVSAAETKAFA